MTAITYEVVEHDGGWAYRARVLELHRWPIFMTERIMEEIGHGASV